MLTNKAVFKFKIESSSPALDFKLWYIPWLVVDIPIDVPWSNGNFRGS